MKSKVLAFSLCAFTSLTTAAWLVHATTKNTAGTSTQKREVWEGSGSTYDVSGRVTSNYKLTLETLDLNGKSESHVIVTTDDGEVIKRDCTTSDESETGWSSNCGQSQGGGHCFGDGLCISYEEVVAAPGDENRTAYATTIVRDGDKEMRLLRTELKNGQAARFFREKLHKN